MNGQRGQDSIRIGSPGTAGISGIRRAARARRPLLIGAVAVGLAMVAATPAGAQPAPEIIGRSSWTTGGQAGVVGATFEAVVPSGGSYTVGLSIAGTGFVGSLSGVADSGLGGSCCVGGDGRSISCTWAAPQAGATASITATVNVSAFPPGGTVWTAVPTIAPGTNVQVFNTGTFRWGDAPVTPQPDDTTTTTEPTTTSPDATTPEVTTDAPTATTTSAATTAAPAAGGTSGTAGGGGGAATTTRKPSTGALPATGGVTRPLVPIAALLVIAGAAVVTVTSRRPRERR